MDTSIDPFWSIPPRSDQDHDIQMEDEALFKDMVSTSSDQSANASNFLQSDLSRQNWHSSSLDLNTTLIPNASIPQALPDFFGIYSSVDTAYAPASSSGTPDDLTFDFDEELRQFLADPTSTCAAIQPARREKSKPGGYPCGDCSRVFDRNCDFTKHYKRAHLAESARPLPCLECPKRFCDLKDLNRHVNSLHPETATRMTSRPLRTGTKRRRLCSPKRHQPFQGQKRKRDKSPLGPRRVRSGHESKPLKTIDSAKHTRCERTPLVIHSPDARYREPASFAWARDSLHELEQMSLDYRSTPPFAQISKASPPGEMVAIDASIVLVTPRELALHFSSQFNEHSGFKLRSLRIRKQRRKLEQALHEAGRERVWPRRKVVFIDYKGDIAVVKDADSHFCLSRLFSMLSYSNDAVQGASLVPSEGFNTAVRVRPFWLRPRGASLRRLREAFVQWLCRQPNIREKLQGYTKGLMGTRRCRRNKLQIVQIQPEGNRYGVKQQGKGAVIWGARDPGASLWRRFADSPAKDRGPRYTTMLCCAALLTGDGDVQNS